MQKESIEIKRLKFREIPKLFKFKAKNDYHAPSESSDSANSLFFSLLRAWWHRNRMATFVACHKGVIVGYVSLVFGRQRRFRENIYIIGASVDEHCRGQGIGTLLFEEVEKCAKSRFTKRIELEVFSRNDRAIKLYKRLGYEIEGIKRHAVESANDYDNLVIMAKLLK